MSTLAMRLRSPHVVFLFLLAFAVQVREDHALRLVTGTTLCADQLRENPSSYLRFSPELSRFERPAPAGLTSQALAAARTPWTMRRPALDSAAVASYTGRIRG